jgi:hypothetical protein
MRAAQFCQLALPLSLLDNYATRTPRRRVHELGVEDQGRGVHGLARRCHVGWLRCTTQGHCPNGRSLRTAPQWGYPGQCLRSPAVARLDQLAYGRGECGTGIDGEERHCCVWMACSPNDTLDEMV